MLAGGTDGLYRSALAAPHRLSARIEVWSDIDPSGVMLAESIPFLTATVSATLQSRVARTMQFTIDRSFYPVEPGDLLNPYGHVVKAFRGIEMGDGSTFYEWPVFVGRIQKATLDSGGVVTVEAADYGSDVVAFEFEFPENSSVGVPIDSEVRRVIADAIPNASFSGFDSYDEVTRPLAWESDRGAALDELCLSVGSFWYALADGSFTMRRYPWTVVSAPVITLSDGPGGVVTAWAVSRDRSQVFNSVVVTGERLNGDAPVHAIARDTTPGSPTEYGANFGVRVEHFRLQTPGTMGAAQTAANDFLRRDIALLESWQWNMIPDASLELGDVVMLNIGTEDREVIQVVESITIPVDLSGPMSVSGRSLIVPALGLGS
jgi:hypothetical protein